MVSQTNEPVYDVLWPLARKRLVAQNAVANVADLSGKTVALIWDRMFQGEAAYAHLCEQLGARYSGINFVSYQEFGDIHGPDERAVIAALPAKLKACGAEAAIVGIGA